ncbi:hypothetical protein BD324DRAFT_616642 [Kockovaella imperatae]|uniref:Zn(2)-C6 fungal-type domain-containing protein n=1 Tax=Kockovaella imperatae TaxID=4999 RepID=A0A1Y1USI8_9TREE|nr:hypothetical protein BD324DRAFT_616642 [Kockovaella imperatae]ORX40165.1 hypothetical protein BD324DRAFT_616642 [Kockovaella imperatae]
MDEQDRAVERRSSTGCKTCRGRRIKCDEERPICGQCQTHGSECLWTVDEPPKKRFRILAACSACRDRKVRCEGAASRDSCARCAKLCIPCEFPEDRENIRNKPAPRSRPSPFIFSGTPTSPSTTPKSTSRPSRDDNASTRSPSNSQSLSRTGLPVSASRTAPLTLEKLINDEVSMRLLVRKYFATVHQHSLLTFLHEPSLTYLVDLHRVPVPLVHLVLALTFLFDDYSMNEPEKRILKADEVFSLGFTVLQSQAFTGYGAMDLMSVLLARAYEYARGRFASADVLLGMATRMMHQLHLANFDDTYPQTSPSNRTDILNPLLKPESLRRLAWSVFYLDCTLTDNGPVLYNINSASYRIPLPLDETCFLRDIHVRTASEPYSNTGTDLRHNECPNHSHLGISAHLIQTAEMRRRVIDLDTSIATSAASLSELLDRVATLEGDAKILIATLPPHLAYTEDNLYIHSPRRPMFQLLHILRHSCFLILARAKLHLSARWPIYSPNDALKDRIRHASAVAGMALDTVQLGINADPYMARVAYEAVESLLSDPPRLSCPNSQTKPTDDIYAKALRQLLDLLRILAIVDATAAYLRVEACARVGHSGFTSLLTEEDKQAMQSTTIPSDPSSELHQFTPHRVQLDLEWVPIAPERPDLEWTPLDAAAVLSPATRTTVSEPPRTGLTTWPESLNSLPSISIALRTSLTSTSSSSPNLPTSSHWDPHESSTWTAEDESELTDNSPDELLSFMGLVQQASKGYAGLDAVESFDWFAH